MLEQDAQRVGVAEGTAHEERRDQVIDGLFRFFAGLTGRVTEQTIVGGDSHQHRVAFDDGALAAVIREAQGLR